MNFLLKPLRLQILAAEKTDVLIVFVDDSFVTMHDAVSRSIQRAMKAGDFQATSGQILDIYRSEGIAATHLVLAQIGSGGVADVKKAVTAAFASIKSTKPQRLTLCFLKKPSALAVRMALTTLSEASYTYTTTNSKPEGRTLRDVTLLGPLDKSVRDAFEHAVAAVMGIEFAKEWGNRPANHATPSHLALAARALARLPGVKCQVLGPKEVDKLGMCAFQAVAQGSDQPLRFIVLQYMGAAKAIAPVVLVGKGITFDSGGISIKPAAEMDEMKFDMCGAASVLGVFKALAQLQPQINVIGLIPSCENLPSGRSVKPGDVVTSMSGQTVEVLNTDAEGRLVLCDALTYAQRFKPRAILDVATLTGACVIALGAVRSGFFCTDEAMSTALLKAGDSSQDLCWPMPLDDDYAEGLKTSFADVANVAGRAGGAITAAKFLQRFAGKQPWAHLDIAGTAWKSGIAKGATGRPVGLLLNYLLSVADQGH